MASPYAETAEGIELLPPELSKLEGLEDAKFWDIYQLWMPRVHAPERAYLVVKGSVTTADTTFSPVRATRRSDSVLSLLSEAKQRLCLRGQPKRVLIVGLH